MNTERSIAALNTLISFHNDNIEGNEMASRKTKEAELNALFFCLSQTSQKCKTELFQEVLIMGGKPSKTNSFRKLLGFFPKLLHVMKPESRKTLLNSCERREAQADAIYNDLLKNNSGDISPVQQSMISRQHQLLQDDYAAVRKLSYSIKL